MKHLKTFENITKDVPQVGDYVIANSNSSNSKIKNFINNNIGKILHISKNDNVTICYENVPEDIIYWFELGTRNIVCKLNNIIHFSKDKDDLEKLLISNKYNL